MKRKAGAVFAAVVLSLVLPAAAMAQTTAMQARDIALAMTGGGVVTSLEMVQEAGFGNVYNITVVNGDTHFDVAVSAQTGDILRMSSFNVPGASGVAAAPATAPPANPAPTVAPGRPRRVLGIFNPNISRDQAVEIAYAHFASRNIQATFLNDSGIGLERGRWVWELVFLSGTGGIFEIYIGTRHGDVVYVEFDSGW
ncbi:MAG: PepSY domain-containing protein [Spirochaetes bacterium]|nr:PepSY domain-containing protein [Spirochaetota bacterium]